MSKPHWRHAHAGDLAAISAIAARIHPDLPERPEVLSEKLRLYPDGCCVLAAGNEIAGYGLAHPWMQRQIPPLDGFLDRLPDAAKAAASSRSALTGAAVQLRRFFLLFFPEAPGHSVTDGAYLASPDLSPNFLFFVPNAGLPNLPPS